MRSLPYLPARPRTNRLHAPRSAPVPDAPVEDTSQKGNLTSDLNGDGETNPAYVRASDRSANGFATRNGSRPPDPRWTLAAMAASHRSML